MFVSFANAPLHSMVTAVGVDATTKANWRTAAALDPDAQYGTLGYVVFGLNEIDGQYRNNWNIGLSEPRNAHNLPAGLTVSTASTGINMWSGNGNFGTMEDPGNADQLTSVPLLANYGGPKRFTISRAAESGYRITLLTASGDGAGANYSPSVNDGTGAASTSHTHTENGLVYHVFQVSPGTSNIVIDITSNPNWSLTGIAFDEYVEPVLGEPLVWTGASPAWDTTTSGNWREIEGGAPVVFANSPVHAVLFDDTGTSTTVEISPPEVTPLSVEFNNTEKDYILQGDGALAGTTGLVKNGGGALTLLNNNTYAGPTNINDGALTLGGSGRLGGGTYAGAILNDGGVFYASSSNQTLSGAISGSGAISHAGPGTLTLAGVNTHTGDVLITGGTLVASRNTGTSASGSFGNLQIEGKTITVGSEGTLRHGNNDLYFNTLAARTAAAALIVLDGGTLDTGTFFSNIKNIELHSGASITGTNGVNSQFRSLGLTGVVSCKGGTGVLSTIDSPGISGGIHLGNSSFAISSVTFDVDSASGGLEIMAPLYNQAASLATGSLVKIGAGVLTLSGASTYTGSTMVGGGTLVVNGSLESASNGVFVSDSAVLSGAGVINRPVSIADGGTLTPGGGAIATLTIGNSLHLGAGSTIICQIDKTGGLADSDQVLTTSVTYGGTLELVATGGPLALGDAFKLFDATSGYAGTFSEVIKPALPAGLRWNIARLGVDGTLEVVDFTPPPTFNPSAGAYVGAQSVTLNSEPGSTIHYTTDGSNPQTSPTVLSGASPVTGVIIPTDRESFTLTAYATEPGLGSSPVVAATYSTITTPAWNVDEDGNWSEAAKWKHNVVPDGLGVTADFSAFPQSASSNVTLDGNRTVGRLVFGSDSSFDWALSSSGGAFLTLATSSDQPVIHVMNQTAVVGAQLAGVQGFTKSGEGILRLTNPGNVFTGDVTVAGGTLLALASTGGPSPTRGSLGDPSVPRTITIHPGATLSFGANDIFGNHSSIANVGLVIEQGATVVNNGNFFNVLGPVVLNGGTLHAIGGANANFPAFSFKGGITAASGVTSTVSGNEVNATYHLGDDLVTETTIEVQGSGILDFQAILQNGQSGGLPTSLIKNGDGTLILGGHNTYNGNTTVNSGTLVLADEARLRFVIGNASGISNQLSGNGAVVLDGAFAIDTAAANALSSGSWLLESVPSLAGAYGATFSVMDPDGTPWTDAGNDTWTKDNGAGILWMFNESAGRLTLGDVGNFESWAAENGVTGGPDGDSDFDGIPNLVEYALDLNPAGSDGSAGDFDGGKVTFTKRALAVAQGDVTYVIEASSSLGLSDPWLPVTPSTNDDSTIEYVLPAGDGSIFVRLAVSLVP
jgi:autotransporter-associated beta strand protein